MGKPLVVNVIELLRRAGTTKDVEVTVAAADLDFGDERIVDEPVEVSLHLESLTNGIAVTGRAGARWAGECRRCLAPVSERVEVVLDERYQSTVEDPDAWQITGDQIDLLPMVRENILLAVPLGPLCRPDCPGICQWCGADLSAGSCGCTPPPTDSPWAVLDRLKDEADREPD